MVRCAGGGGNGGIVDVNCIRYARELADRQDAAAARLSKLQVAERTFAVEDDKDDDAKSRVSFVIVMMATPTDIMMFMMTMRLTALMPVLSVPPDCPPCPPPPPCIQVSRKLERDADDDDLQMAAIRRVVHAMAGRRSMPHAQLAARLVRKKVGAAAAGGGWS